MVFLMKIGVIAIQGAVSEHIDALRRALEERGVDAEVVAIKQKELFRNAAELLFLAGKVPRFAGCLPVRELQRRLRTRLQEKFRFLGPAQA